MLIKRGTAIHDASHFYIGFGDDKQCKLINLISRPHSFFFSPESDMDEMRLVVSPPVMMYIKQERNVCMSTFYHERAIGCTIS